ncbi:TetR/AcrR family transcriptional regulator [Streptomyces sp. NPDC004542]|uniref:TetR/AcrR family transcriptional regulator n=1 Tax=Streptomyces sp. NPDC004542 TaxID=3154281 RepID=UPI0033A19278
MSPQGWPSPPPRGRGRENVLTAAKALFHECGYDATSIRDIALRAGITKAAVFRHVRSKSELLRCATAPLRGVLFASLGSGADGPGRGVDDLAAALKALAGAAAADPAGHALLWRGAGPPDADGLDALCRAAVFRRLVDLVERAVAEGDVPGGIEPWLVARLLLGAVVGVDCLADETASVPPGGVDALLHGLAPGARRPAGAGSCATGARARGGRPA